MSIEIQIKGSDFGLEENKAKEISAMFKPMLDTMVKLEEEYNALTKQQITPNTILAARELRMKYVKVRTGTAAIHKQLKEFYLKGGRFVDSWKNAQIMASDGMEKKLLDIEEHFERQKAAKLQELIEHRRMLLAPFTQVDTSEVNVGEMSEQVWDAYYSGTKQKHQEQLELIKAAQEQEKLEEYQEQARTARWNILMPYNHLITDREIDPGVMEEIEFANLLADLKKKKVAFDQRNEFKIKLAEYRDFISPDKSMEDILNMTEKDFNQEILHLMEKKNAYLVQQQQIMAENKRLAAANKKNSDKLAAEAKKRQLLQDELDAKEEADRQAAEALEAEKERKLAASDKEKYLDFENDLEQLSVKYLFKSKKYTQLYKRVNDGIATIVKTQHPKS